MHSSLLKSICYILIINVTFCTSRSCNQSLCRAKCYFKNSGFDYGACNIEKNICECNPADIYVFDGIDNANNGEYINYSMGRIRYRREIWEKIVSRITMQYSFIRIEDLINLKLKIFEQQPDLLQYFFTTYMKHNSLETVLNTLIEQYPQISVECNTLLMRLKRSENNESETVYTSSEEVSEEDEDISSQKKSLIETPPIETPPPIKTPSPIKTPPPIVTTTKTNDGNNIAIPKVSGTQPRSLMSSSIKPQSNNNEIGTDANKKLNSGTKLVQKDSKPNIRTGTTHEVEFVSSYEEETEEESSEEEEILSRKSNPIENKKK